MRHVIVLMISAICAACVAAPNAVISRVENQVVREKPGTRSEISHGSLIVDGVRLPDTFRQVVADGVEYVFLKRIHLWGQDGYFPTRRIVEFTTSDSPVTESELARGWYDGDSLRPGTPKSWIYVRWEHGARFVAPSAIGALVRAESLEDIERFVDEGLHPTEK